MFKKNKIEFYSFVPGVKELFPVVPSSEYIPKWFKEKNKHMSFLKKQCPFKRIFNIINCPGIRQFFNTGYILRLHTDLRVITEKGVIKDIKWGFGYENSQVKSHFSNNETVSIHRPEVLGNWMPPPRKAIKELIKIDTPWNVYCPPNYVLLETNPFYSDDNRFHITGGILDPQISRNINPSFWWFVEDGVEDIKAGTPIAQFIPIRRKNELKLVVRDINQKDIDYSNRYSYLIRHKNTFTNYDYINLSKKIN